MLAISGTKGSSGLASVKREEILNKTNIDYCNTFAYCQCWGPLVFKDVQTDGTILVDIWMVYTSDEVDLRGFEGVICGEMNI